LPLQGIAGGRPGACNEFVIHRGDGSEEMIDVSTSGAVVGADDWFEMRIAIGGGYGDPLDRDPERVERDIRHGRIGEDEARIAYGVVAGDAQATAELRHRLRHDRLARAQPAVRSLSRDDVVLSGEPVPLYPGIVQVGSVAAASESGAPLALAPDHWTEGCPLLAERRWGAGGPDVDYNSWLDPETGRVLYVEVALEGEERGFLVAPKRWTQAVPSGR